MSTIQIPKFFSWSAVLFLFLFFLPSCLPDNDPVLESAQNNLAVFLEQIDQEILDAELAVIDDSLEAWGLIDEVLIDEQGGVRYIVHSAGSGKNPRLNSFIAFDYSGKLLYNQQEFDSGEALEAYLYQLIAGFQTTLPQVKKGTVMTMYIPSTLGYGDQDVTDGEGNSIIPAHSNLIFELELHEVE
jgi:hypothetical protein